MMNDRVPSADTSSVYISLLEAHSIWPWHESLFLGRPKCFCSTHVGCGTARRGTPIRLHVGAATVEGVIFAVAVLAAELPAGARLPSRFRSTLLGDAAQRRGHAKDGQERELRLPLWSPGIGDEDGKMDLEDRITYIEWLRVLPLQHWNPKRIPWRGSEEDLRLRDC